MMNNENDLPTSCPLQMYCTINCESNSHGLTKCVTAPSKDIITNIAGLPAQSGDGGLNASVTCLVLRLDKSPAPAIKYMPTTG